MAERVGKNAPCEDRAGSFYVRAINGTGIFLHTGLGRAPFSPVLMSDLGDRLKGYTIVEIDRGTGDRICREEGVCAMFRELTNAESALVVNNNAAAVLLTVSVLAQGGEVVISRGELIEIGGGFRIPEVLSSSGAVLREVGTTNSTRIDDYENALSNETRLLMKVHASNYKVVGDGSAPSRREIVALGNKHSIPVVEDLGSGLINRYGITCLNEEPTVIEALGRGVDVITFSGDKLFGGPQCGLILGRARLLEELRAAPLFRAVRPDKMTLALIEQVLRRYIESKNAPPDLPFFRAVTAKQDSLRDRAMRIAGSLDEKVKNGRFGVVGSKGFVGSGSAPEQAIPSYAVAISIPGMKPHVLARKLRDSSPPLFATIKMDEVRIDMLTLLADDDEIIVRIFESLSLPSRA